MLKSSMTHDNSLVIQSYRGLEMDVAKGSLWTYSFLVSPWMTIKKTIRGGQIGGLYPLVNILVILGFVDPGFRGGCLGRQLGHAFGLRD